MRKGIDVEGTKHHDFEFGGNAWTEIQSAGGGGGFSELFRLP